MSTFFEGFWVGIGSIVCICLAVFAALIVVSRRRFSDAPPPERDDGKPTSRND